MPLLFLTDTFPVLLELHNPHSVLAALEKRPRDVVEIAIGAGKVSEPWQRVAEASAPHGISVRQSRGSARRERSHGSTERGGASYARVKPFGGVGIDRVLPQDAPAGGLWIALDRLTDPHNVGAIFRTAAFYGVQGIILTRDRSAPLNATVFDIACGGMEHVPFCVEGNLARAAKRARDAGLWILGTSEHAQQDVAQVDCERPWLMFIGNEEKGLRRLTLEQCDETCRLTPQGAVTSLNASVAAGILISTLSRPAE